MTSSSTESEYNNISKDLLLGINFSDTDKNNTTNKVNSLEIATEYKE